jgi:hypothetical protein
MTDLRTAAQRLLEAIDRALPEAPLCSAFDVVADTADDLRAALAQPKPTVKESLMVPQHIADHLTTTDLAWLETRRLVRVWKELGQMRWMGADEGWDKAIEAVRARLDKECQAVLEWKEKADDSGETAKKVLHNMQGVKHD